MSATKPAKTRSGSVALQAHGIECYVVDAASIPAARHRRRPKTDRLDAIKLVLNLRAWLHGERDRMHVVHVPSVQDEALRHLTRDRAELQKEVLQHRNRMEKLLRTLGCWDDLKHGFANRLARGRSGATTVLHCPRNAPSPPARMRTTRSRQVATHRPGEGASPGPSRHGAPKDRPPHTPEGRCGAQLACKGHHQLVFRSAFARLPAIHFRLEA
ncbi:transposase [Cupriavidus necator]|uniref:IS110 family transposase n=1 Tax=Cupriavidus necator TaxID=106590 RepID=UPI0029C4E52D|nr:transposase [Cupriavidus necator]MDX6008407.1 transposase [Cupriavidus necator]